MNQAAPGRRGRHGGRLIDTHHTHRLTLCALIGLLLTTGCAHVYDPIDASLTCLHYEAQAKRTWRHVRGNYSCVCYPHHFGGGFRAGYVNVCRGGDGCPPTMPPRLYWSIWFRNPSGRAKTVEWFNGFSAGATAAMQDGHQVYGQIVTARDVTGRCAKMVEYDLSDFPRAEAAPGGSDDDLRVDADHQWPGSDAADDSPLVVLPVPSAHETDNMTGTADSESGPFGHSRESELPQLDISPDESPSVMPTPPIPTFTGAPASVPLPFGHSSGPLNPPSASPTAPRPLQEHDDASRVSTDAPPEPDSQPECSQPDGSSAAEPIAPTEEHPPLEDLFLPRPDQQPNRSARPDGNNVRTHRRPRSLYEVFHSVRQAAHMR